MKYIKKSLQENTVFDFDPNLTKNGIRWDQPQNFANPVQISHHL